MRWLQQSVNTSKPLFCKVCKPFTILDAKARDVFRDARIIRTVRQAPIATIRRQADSGCRLCRVLEEIFDKLLSLGRVEDQEQATSLRLCKDRPNFRIYDRRGNELTFAQKVEVCFVEGAERIFLESIASRPYLPLRLDHETSFDAIRTWISTCEADHNLCRQDSKPELPRRLLAVGDRESGTPLQLFISRNGERDDYLALSHCWGDSSTVPQLTKDVVEQYQSTIPEHVLSNTFRDAVNITRRLGYRYIWIDALCIIQDSLEDWGVEAAKMAEVYGRARLTIAPASSADGAGGCFYERSGITQIPIEAAAGLGTRMFIKSIHKHDCSRALLNPTKGIAVDRLPLFSRKWTYQERLMSRRIVYYTREEIIWECKSRQSCECAYEEGYTSKSGFAQAIHPQAEKYGEAEKYRITQFHDTVEAYSKRDITYETDILPAFSALARSFAHKWFGQYCAGVWKEALPGQLSWEVAITKDSSGDRTRRRPAQRSSDYCAPTWSWASIHAEVTFGDHLNVLRKSERDWVARVNNVRCELLTSDPFGAVSYGVLDLNAPAIEAQVIEVDASSLDVDLVTTTYSAEPDRCNIDTLEDLETLKGATIWFVLLSTGENHNSGRRLLLEPLQDGGFKRVGIARHHWLDRTVKHLKKAPRKNFKIV